MERHQQFAKFYSMDAKNEVCFCHDILGTFKELQYSVNDMAGNWRLFVDSGKRSLKAMLLNNGNNLVSIPIAFAYNLKESFESIAHIFNLIQYDNFKWKVVGDLKVISMISGLQGGYTKHMCVFCLWNSRDDENHWIKRNWPPRNDHTIRKFNVINKALVDKNDLIMPGLHLQLGFMTQFVKAMDKNGPGFLYLIETFGSKLSKEKIKAGIFIGPQIRKLMKDSKFLQSLNPQELEAWQSFVLVSTNFLGNYKAPNYKELISKMMAAFKTHGTRMSLKMHLIDSHLDVFPPNLGDVSDQHGERCHQDMARVEKCYQGRFGPNFCGEYLWRVAFENE